MIRFKLLHHSCRLFHQLVPPLRRGAFMARYVTDCMIIDSRIVDEGLLAVDGDRAVVKQVRVASVKLLGRFLS